MASSRGWRQQLPPKHQVRAEVLRQYAKEHPMGAEQRASATFQSPNAWLWRDHSDGRVPEPV